MVQSFVRTVDISPFFRKGDDDGKKAASKLIEEACLDNGFFQIVNHGIPIELTNRALQLSKTFFEYPYEEKIKYNSANCENAAGAPISMGYNKHPDNCPDKNEFVFCLHPGSPFNIYPKHPPQIKEVWEEMFVKLGEVCSVLESIINDCLGLPPDFLKKYNDDRSWDILTAMHYFSASTELDGDNDNGLAEHEDSNSVTLIIQDEIGGLQISKDGEWLPVPPVKGAIVVNIGDVIQVLSNKKFKSSTHRVVRTKGRDRYSFAFFYNLLGEKWVEPLPQFTKQIGEKPKYRGFEYKEYQLLRNLNKTNPPARKEDIIHITHYEIPSD